MHEASKNAARRIAELEEQLTEAHTEADRIRGELKIPDATCQIERHGDHDFLVVEVEGCLAGALRAAAHEIDTIGRRGITVLAQQSARGLVVDVKLADEETPSD